MSLKPAMLFLATSAATSEPDFASDSFAMRARAEPAGSGRRINRTTTFVPNRPADDLAIVFAVTNANKGIYGGGNAPFKVGGRLERDTTPRLTNLK